MTGGGLALSEKIHFVQGLAPIVPSSSTPARVNLKDVEACEVVIQVTNATTVTGSAITLQQSKSSSGTDEKALAFTTYFTNLTSGSQAVFVRATASNNTFTTLTTNSANAIYRIPVNPASLDIAGGFTFLRAGTANATAATVSVYYLLKMSYGGNIVLFANVRA
jgi:hypothetical protein